MNFGPLSDLERDACLVEDVVKDAAKAWSEAKGVVWTPRALERIAAVLTRLHDTSDHLTRLRVEIHELVREARRA